MAVLVMTATMTKGGALPRPRGNRLDHEAYPADDVPASMAPAQTTRRLVNNPEEGGLSYEANPSVPGRREGLLADVMPLKIQESLVTPPKSPVVTPTTVTMPNHPPEETVDTPSPVAPDRNQSEAEGTSTPPATALIEQTPIEDIAHPADHEAVLPPIQI